MPRPKLPRTIHSPPSIEKFNPSGSQQSGEIVLSFEEFEAIRLIDFEGMGQSEASAHMGISRQTFGRVLRSARFTVSKSLVEGFQLKVTGGCYQLRGQGRNKDRAIGSGRQRRRHFAQNNKEQQRKFAGGTQMTENNKESQGQSNTDTLKDKAEGMGKGQGRGQGRGSGTGRGKGGGKGKGRGLGGGKGDGSCGRS